jgi:hypothetical protein
MSPEFRTALSRGILHALIVGATAFLAAWSTSDDPKTLIIATVTPMLTVLATRFLGEGAVDTRAAERPGSPQAAARRVAEREAR